MSRLIFFRYRDIFQDTGVETRDEPIKALGIRLRRDRDTVKMFETGKLRIYSYKDTL